MRRAADEHKNKEVFIRLQTDSVSNLVFRIGLFDPSRRHRLKTRFDNLHDVVQVSRNRESHRKLEKCFGKGYVWDIYIQAQLRSQFD